MSFDERWRKVMESYQKRVRNDERLKKLMKLGEKLSKRVGRIREQISARQTEILSEEVEREFYR